MLLRGCAARAAARLARRALLAEPCGAIAHARAHSHLLASTSGRCAPSIRRQPLHRPPAAFGPLPAAARRPIAAAAAEGVAELEPTCWKCTVSNVSSSDAELLTDALLR
jgi:hypothetical protein